MPVDYERLKEVDAIMGSGGMVVMDEDTCIVDVAKYFLGFTKEESCGKCTACREGSDVLLKILDKICNGQGTEEDLTLLEDLGQAVKEASLCGLGQTLPNPVLSTLRHFRDEYEAHIRDRRCPAGVCKALFQYEIDEEKCTGCEVCKKNCPLDAIQGDKKAAHVIIQERCDKCGACYEVCAFDAVTKVASGKKEAFVHA
jgi:ferredoxin